MNQVIKKQSPAKLIAISIAVAIIVVVLIYALFPRTTEQTLFLDELPRAYFLYNGLTLNMDGSPEETFWLRDGLGSPIDNTTAKDGKCRAVAGQAFNLTLERWQARSISIELGIFTDEVTESLTLVINGKEVTTAISTPGYQVLNFIIPDEYLIPGGNKVTVQVNGINPIVLVDYVRWHLGTSDSSAKPEVDERLVDGKQVSVIGAAGPYEMNCYLTAPRLSHLQLTIGHDGGESIAQGNKLRIWYRGYSSGEKLLWEGEYPAKGTRKLDLPLSNFDNEIFLLSFNSKPNPEAEDWFYLASPQIVYPAQPPAPEPKQPLVMNDKAPRTIVLIYEDAMRRDMLSFYGNPVVKTPNLERIANSGVIFENCYAPSNHTFNSFPSMFTSLPFTQNGTYGFSYRMAGDVPTLAGILSQNNWSTALFTSSPRTGYNHGMSRGFKKLYEIYNLMPNIDHYSLEDYIPWLQDYLDHLSPNSDAFLTIHLMDTHKFILAPTKSNIDYAMVYEQILGQMPWLGETNKAFSAEVLSYIVPHFAIQTYLDDKLPMMLALISKYRDPANTIFILLSDHGEELLEHSGWGHGVTMYEEVIHIPLVVWGNGVVPARCEQYVNGIDLLPTILDLAGIESPQGIEGISFAGKLGGDETVQARPIFAAAALGDENQKTVVLESWKLIYSDNMPQLYNLCADPGETNNQYTTNPVVFGYMRGILQEWWLRIFSKGLHKSEEQLKLSDREIEVLKGLGYIQ